MNNLLVINIFLPINKKFMKDEVLYSLFHLIEHLFIKKIKIDTEFYKDVYGQTKKNEICLTIIVNYFDYLEINEKKILISLKEMIINADNVSKEYRILDNELEMLSKL